VTTAESLFVADHGAGTPVLLLHGQPGASDHLSLVADLLEVDHRVINVDRPGYGRSTNPPMDIGSQADLLADLLRARGASPAIVVAHSFGGAVALLMATLHPDVVAGLVLAASVGGEGSIEFADRLLAAPLVGGLASTLSLATYGVLGPVAARLPGFRSLAGNVPVTPTLSLLDARRAFLFEQRDLVAEAEVLLAACSIVACPTVVLQGTADNVLLASAGRDLADRIPRAAYVELAGLGHLLPRDAPEEMADAVRAVEAQLS
jgi:pimeloyl-ACP methyl ester carboxylesterase